MHNTKDEDTGYPLVNQDRRTRDDILLVYLEKQQQQHQHLIKQQV